MKQPVDLELAVLSTTAMARRLEVSTKTIRAWNRRELLPEPIVINGRMRWRADEIVAWRNAGMPPRCDWTYSAA